MEQNNNFSNRSGGSLSMDKPWILKPIVRVNLFSGKHPRVGVYLWPVPYYERFGTIARISVYVWRWRIGVEFHYVEYLRSDY